MDCDSRPGRNNYRYPDGVKRNQLSNGDKSIAVSGVAEVTLKFGDDGSEQYSNLLASGAFSDFGTRNIFEDKGMLA